MSKMFSGDPLGNDHAPLDLTYKQPYLEIKLEKSPKAATEEFPRDGSGTKSVSDKISMFEKKERRNFRR